MLDRFAADQGYEFIYRPLPASRLFNALVTGRIDAKYPDSLYWAADLRQGKEIAYSDG